MTPTETPPPDPGSLHGRAETTPPPQLCGFHEGTSSILCSTGYTCKFNTDLYAVACCSDDVCDWRTSCCDYNPSPATGIGTYTPKCGGADPLLVGYCGWNSGSWPWCATYRWENGFVSFFCTADANLRTGTVHFTSAGETTVREGLIRLTGRNGPGTPVTQGPTTVTATVIAEVGSTSAGAIAGGAVGGVAFGAIVTLLGLFLAGYFRRREKGREATGSSLVTDQTQSPTLPSWRGSGQREPQAELAPRQEMPNGPPGYH